MTLKEKNLANKEIESVRRYRVEYGSHGWGFLRRKKPAESKFGMRRYEELIAEAIEDDLGEIIYLTYRNKETCQN